MAETPHLPLPRPFRPEIQHQRPLGNPLFASEPRSSQSPLRPPSPDSARPRTQINNTPSAQDSTPPRALQLLLVAARA